MIRLEIKNYNMILTGKQHYHQIKLINMNILQVKKLWQDQENVIEQAKFTYSPLGEVLEKQITTIDDPGENK